MQNLKHIVPRPFWPLLGQMRRRLRAIPTRTQQQKRRLEAEESLTESDRQLLAKTSSDIHYNDTIYRGDCRHYFSVGLSSIQCIDRAMAAAKLTEIQTALDFPCGH